MSHRRLARLASLWTAAALLAMPAAAAIRTYVSLASTDPTAHKLGVPGIAVDVRGPVPSQAATTKTELARELAKLVYTRDLAQGEAGDYDLAVTLSPREDGSSVTTLPFAAVLTSAEGAVLWRVVGRTEVTGAAVDASVFASIARNVLSALVRDGWLAPRYDPADPPPATPEIRRD